MQGLYQAFGFGFPNIKWLSKDQGCDMLNQPQNVAQLSSVDAFTLGPGCTVLPELGGGCKRPSKSSSACDSKKSVRIINKLQRMGFLPNADESERVPMYHLL